MSNDIFSIIPFLSSILRLLTSNSSASTFFLLVLPVCLTLFLLGVMQEFQYPLITVCCKFSDILSNSSHLNFILASMIRVLIEIFHRSFSRSFLLSRRSMVVCLQVARNFKFLTLSRSSFFIFIAPLSTFYFSLQGRVVIFYVCIH
jgi:hypothetical protein